MASAITRAGVVCGLSVAVALGTWPAPAAASFPGGDGMLAVQPVSGPGLILVAPDGHDAHRLLVAGDPSARASRPAWSADGADVAFNAHGRHVYVEYPDGSCEGCPGVRWKGGDTVHGDVEGRLPGGALLLQTTTHLTRVGPDGANRVNMSGHPALAAWSAHGVLAEITRSRHREWLATFTTHRRRSLLSLPHGGVTSLSWSPGGGRIVFAQRGVIELVNLATRAVSRLGRGSDPVWSPDGSELAFVAPDRRIAVQPLRGGRPRWVGRVRGVRLDWQPLVRRPPGCHPLPGAVPVASSATAVVTGRGDGESYLYCLRADGRQRLLLHLAVVGDGDWQLAHGQILLAGDFAAALETYADHFGNCAVSAQVFDLRRDSVIADPMPVRYTDLCSDAQSALPMLALNDAGDIAWIVAQLSGETAATEVTTDSLAVDVGGHTETLDTDSTGVPYPYPPGFGLAGLSLGDSTVSWTHDGSPRSAPIPSTLDR